MKVSPRLEHPSFGLVQLEGETIYHVLFLCLSRVPHQFGLFDEVERNSEYQGNLRITNWKKKHHEDSVKSKHSLALLILWNSIAPHHFDFPE